METGWHIAGRKGKWCHKSPLQGFLGKKQTNKWDNLMYNGATKSEMCIKLSNDQTSNRETVEKI